MRKIDYSRLTVSLSRTMGRYPSNITCAQFVKEIAGNKLSLNREEARRLFKHYVDTGVLEAKTGHHFTWKRHQDFFTVDSVKKTMESYGLISHFGRKAGVSPFRKQQEEPVVNPSKESEVLEPEIISEPAPFDVFTTEQLRDELVRRGWHVTLS